MSSAKCLVYVIVKNLGLISEPVLFYSLVFSDPARFGCTVGAACAGSGFCCSTLVSEDLNVV